MSAEAVVVALLAVPGVTNIVGDRTADTQLPDGTALPALAYELISSVPQYPIGAKGAPQLVRSRVQMSALDATVAGTKVLQDAVKAAMNLKSGMLGGTQVTSVVIDIEGPKSRASNGAWMRPVDYLILHWETN